MLKEEKYILSNPSQIFRDLTCSYFVRYTRDNIHLTPLLMTKRTRPLTKKQKETLNYITEFITLNGYAPSYQEIADYFGLTSKATVYSHVKTLEDKGYLKSPSEARSMEVIPVESSIDRPAVELPMVGMIAAGEPIEAIENREHVTVPRDFIRDPDDAFVLRVRGDSMVDDGILNGDFVIVERNFYPKNGDVVVALLENEYATLKRYYREKNYIRLQPANRNYRPLKVKNPVIQGIVRGVIRKFQTS